MIDEAPVGRVTLPVMGSQRPAKTRSKDVFPHPLGPVMSKFSGGDGERQIFDEPR